jgi:serine/threonine-protein kinase RsbW
MSNLLEEHWDLPPDLAAVGKGRRMAREVLVSWGLERDLVDETELVVGELLANAIRHGEAPTTLSMRFAGRCIGGEVHDQGDMFEAPPEASKDAEHGRGLHIVDAYVDQWGVDPAGDGRGKVVWWKRCW